MKPNRKTYDYGKCHVCGEQMLEKQINQDFWIKGKLLVIEDVPAGVCPRCGERVVRAGVGQQVMALIQNARRLRKTRTMKVPVISFVKEVA
jgi:HTH-type transcriptional regulator/antitoxin MqsA